MTKIIKTFEGFMNFEDEKELGPINQPEIDHEGHHEAENYMFFGNLETIKRCVESLLEMDPAKVDELLRNGHNWAVDHVVSSKDDIEEVYNFLVNEMSEPNRMHEGKSYLCKECNMSYVEEDLNEDATCEACGSKLEESEE